MGAQWVEGLFDAVVRVDEFDLACSKSRKPEFQTSPRVSVEFRVHTLSRSQNGVGSLLGHISGESVDPLFRCSTLKGLHRATTTKYELVDFQQIIGGLDFDSNHARGDTP